VPRSDPCSYQTLTPISARRRVPCGATSSLLASTRTSRAFGSRAKQDEGGLSAAAAAAVRSRGGGEWLGAIGPAGDRRSSRAGTSAPAARRASPSPGPRAKHAQGRAAAEGGGGGEQLGASGAAKDQRPGRAGTFVSGARRVSPASAPTVELARIGRAVAALKRLGQWPAPDAIETVLRKLHFMVGDEPPRGYVQLPGLGGWCDVPGRQLGFGRAAGSLASGVARRGAGAFPSTTRRAAGARKLQP
jgi:hypothetical protein